MNTNDEMIRLAQNIVMAADQITVDATDAINYPESSDASRNLRSMLAIIKANMEALETL